MPNSAFELMLEGNLTDSDRQRMLAQQLRNRRQTGELAMLSGDRVLQPLGERLSNEALDKEVGSLNLKADEVAGAENTRRWGLDEAMGRRRQDEVERHNKAMEAAALLNAQRANATAQRAADTNVRRLSEKMTQYGIPELSRDVSVVGDLIAKHGGNLPGAGATAWLPEVMLSNEGVEFRQAIATVRNKLLKLRSGAAVTDPEMSRLAEELGQKLGGSDREIVLAWPSIVEGISTIENGILSGYDPEIVETFQGRFSSREEADDEVSGSSRATPRGTPPATGEARRVKWSDL